MNIQAVSKTLTTSIKQAGYFRIGLVSFLILLFFGPADLRQLTLETMSEAYIAVTSFVAATLALFFLVENLFKVNISEKIEKAKHWQVVFASLMGALPGCGGAIIVVTQYARGKISFGSLVAVLIATMGDAAFLMLAQEPLTGILIFALGFSVGSITGYIVDFIHGRDFMRRKRIDNIDHDHDLGNTSLISVDYIWIFLIIPGFMLGLANAFQIDVDALLGSNIIDQPTVYFGAIGAALCILMWSFRHITDHSTVFGSDVDAHDYNVSGKKLDHIACEDLPPALRVIGDTNFVTVWVVMAFLSYELFLYAFSIDLAALFETYAVIMPLIAIVIGFIPGCGPQILVTTLYLQGVIPLSAQLGNAISNDGDALFPAIALAPRSAILATVYSAVPAVLIAYFCYFFLHI